MGRYVYALDRDGYQRLVIFDTVNDEGITEYSIACGVCGCLYDGVIDGYASFDDAFRELQRIVEEDYDQVFDPYAD